MKKFLLLIAIASLSIITLGTAQAQNTANTSNSNETVNVVGKKYRCKIPFKDIWYTPDNEEARDYEKERKQMTQEQKAKIDSLLDAIDCYMTVYFKSAEKMTIGVKVSMNKEKGRALGLNALQRSTIGTMFSAACGSSTLKYVRKGAILYDVEDKNEEEPMEIINSGKALKVKDNDLNKTYVLKEIK